MAQCRRYLRQNSVAGLTAPRIFRRSRTTPSRTWPAAAAASQAPPACGPGHVSPSSACSTSPEHRRIRRFARPCAGPPPLCSLRPVCQQKWLVLLTTSRKYKLSCGRKCVAPSFLRLHLASKNNKIRNSKYPKTG